MLRVGSLLNHLPRPEITWIEVASTLQLPGVHLIGLPGPEVGEAVDRVQAALVSSGFEIPRRRWVVHLAPAGVRKTGAGMDAAIALGLLAAAREQRRRGERGRREKSGRSVLAWAELGLDGTLKPAGCATRLAWAALSAGVDGVLVARADAARVTQALEELAFSGGGPAGDAAGRPFVAGVSHLHEAWERLEAPECPPPALDPIHRPSIEPPAAAPSHAETGLLPLPPSLLRAVCATAAGSHHLLLLGPRGVGKSHALEWIRALQPRPDARALVEHRLLQELAWQGEIPPSSSGTLALGSTHESLVRRVGTHAKPAALLGTYGTNGLRPGEFSLAHGGLLVADELPEWARDSRESLREPLERGLVTLTRAGGSIELSAGFRLAASGNLCPCGGWPGHLPAPERAPPCRCSPAQLRSYLQRLSGPILDRIDLTVTVLSSTAPEPHGSTGAAGSHAFPAVAQQCEEARSRLQRHWGKPSGLIQTQDLEAIIHDLGGWAQLTENLPRAARKGAPSSLRSRHKQARVALTLSALDGKERPAPCHWKEAALLRSDPWLSLDSEIEQIDGRSRDQVTAS